MSVDQKKCLDRVYAGFLLTGSEGGEQTFIYLFFAMAFL